MPASNSCSMFNWFQLNVLEIQFDQFAPTTAYSCVHAKEQWQSKQQTSRVTTGPVLRDPRNSHPDSSHGVKCQWEFPFELQLSCPLSILSSLCMLSNHESMAVHLEALSDMSFATVTIATSILVLPALTWWPYWLLPRQLNEASPSIDFAFEQKLTEPNRLWQPKHWLRAIHACHSDCSKACAFLHNNTWHDTY